MPFERIFATLAYALLASGLLLRKNRRVHPVLMGSGIAVDTAMVLMLEIQRGVIQSSITQSYSALEWGHIACSTIAFLIYFAVVPLGVRQVLRKGGATERAWHVRVGLTAFAFRTVGFVLMFTVDGGV